MKGFLFKPGDKVKVINGSDIEDYAGTWVDEMNDFVNTECTIRKCVQMMTGKYKFAYKLNETWQTFDQRGLVLVSRVADDVDSDYYGMD